MPTIEVSIHEGNQLRVSGSANAKKVCRLLEKEGVATQRPVQLTGTASYVVKLQPNQKVSFTSLRAVLAKIMEISVKSS